MKFRNAKVVGFDVDSAAYHRQDANRGTPEFSISPSSLKEFAFCPARWQAGYESPGSDSKAWGNMLDCMALTPELFKTRYIVQPETYPATDKGVTTQKPWNGNAAFCREWKAEAKRSGREPISTREMGDVSEASSRLYADPKISAFLHQSARQALVVGECETEDYVFPVRCLIDLAPWYDSEFSDCLGDLKTTQCAGLRPFAGFAKRMGYHIQAAFDLDLWNAATGQERSTWCFILQENFAPWQTGRRIFSQDFIEFGRREYKSALELYGKCMATGRWPGYDDTDESAQGWGIVHPEPWMENESSFAPKFEFSDEEDAPTS